MNLFSIYDVLWRGARRQVKGLAKDSNVKRFVALHEKWLLEFGGDAGKETSKIQNGVDSVSRGAGFRNTFFAYHRRGNLSETAEYKGSSCANHFAIPTLSHRFHSSAPEFESQPESESNASKSQSDSPQSSPKPKSKGIARSKSAPKKNQISNKKKSKEINEKNEGIPTSTDQNPRPKKRSVSISKKESINNGRKKKKAVPPMDAQKLLAEMEERLEKVRKFHLQPEEREKIVQILRMFATRGWAADQALAIYINSKFFPTAASRFQKFVLRTITPSLRDALLTMGVSDVTEEYIFPLFAEYCFNHFSNEIKSYRDLVNSANMTKPHSWFPYARAMKRKIIYHRGPTNSGKTYNALQRLRQASSGVYLGPLRLLAMEVYDTLNSEGLYCNLITGQERKILPFSNHSSCTIEMANINQSYGVAVIDEIQMIMDEYRGWAWTRALLGLQAEEIHLCGDSSALSLIKDICQSTGDEFTEEEYERFMPLTVDETSLLGDFTRIEPGDCIVAFSRREIFEIKRQVEMMTKHKCCVVYGALPPETRRQQAKLFNNPSSGYDVLVASDAIGMGLNLNIRRIIFFSLFKFNGESKALIPPPMVKQIAGRAGRRSSIYPEGIVTSFFSQDMPFLIQALQTKMELIQAAGLFPFFEQVELFASKLPEMSFAQLLDRFVETSKVDGAYFLCKTDNLRRVAKLLEKVRGLSLEDRFNFCFAPANSRDPLAMSALLSYAEDFSQGQPVQLFFPEVNIGSSHHIKSEDYHILNLETKHQVASLYMWLSHQFQREAFPEIEEAETEAVSIALKLADSLTRSSNKRIIKKIQKNQSLEKSVRDEDDSGEGNQAETLPKWITS